MFDQSMFLKQLSGKWLIFVTLLLVPGIGFLVGLNNLFGYLVLGLFFAGIFCFIGFQNIFLAFAIMVLIASSESFSSIRLFPGVSVMILLGLLFVLIWIIRISVEKPQFFIDKDYYLFLAFVILLVVSSLINGFGESGYRPFLTYIQQLLLVLLIIYFVNSPAKLATMGSILIISGTLIALPMILAKVGITSSYGFGVGINNTVNTMDDRMMGFFSDPNFTSSQLILTFPFVVEWWQITHNKIGKALLLFSGFMILVGVYLTLSITGLLGLLTYLLIKALLLSADNSYLRILKAGSGLVIVALLVILVYPSSFQAKLTQNLTYIFPLTESGSSISLSDFGSGRGNNWQAAIQAVADSPLIGHGAGNGVYANAHYNIYQNLTLRSAHNMYLDVGSDLGILGMMIFILLFTRPWLGLWPQEMDGDDVSLLKSSNRAIFAALTICMLMGVSLSLNILKLPWILIGLGFVGWRLVGQKPVTINNIDLRESSLG